MTSIFDRSFRYTSSAETDVRKTFARVRGKMRGEEEICASTEALAKVSPGQAETPRGHVRDRKFNPAVIRGGFERD